MLNSCVTVRTGFRSCNPQRVESGNDCNPSTDAIRPRNDVRVKNGHLVVIGAERYRGGKLVVSLQPRW